MMSANNETAPESLSGNPSSEKDNQNGENVHVNVVGADEAEPMPPDTDETETDQISETDGDEDALAAAKAEHKDTYDRLLRLSADFENYKKRSAREMTEFRKFANESLIKEMLPVLDNLERALQVSLDNHEASKGLIEGVDMTLKEILRILSKFGVTQVEAMGNPFDPAFHQAVTREECVKSPENTVIREFQKGYMLHDRLLRPAMVAVACAPSKEEETNGDAQKGAPEK